MAGAYLFDWNVQGAFPRLTLSGGGLGEGVSRSFAFSDVAVRDKFFSACRNLAAGRQWNDDAADDAIPEGTPPKKAPDPEPEPEPEPEPVAALTADGNDQVDDGSGGGDGEAEAESEPWPQTSL